MCIYVYIYIFIHVYTSDNTQHCSVLNLIETDFGSENAFIGIGGGNIITALHKLYGPK